MDMTHQNQIRHQERHMSMLGDNELFDFNLIKSILIDGDKPLTGPQIES